MFGRETSDHFVDLGRQSLGHKMESWEEMKTKAEKRLNLLDEIPSVNKNSYLKYQKAMEKFYISFFEKQMLFQDAFSSLKDGDTAQAKEIIINANPDETIQKYADATKLIGFKSGEKAIVFSMNTRWKVDFINLKQRLGMEPVRYKFAPTQHDPLAQSPGHFTYFIDEEKNWWRCIWENEMKNSTFIQNEDKTALLVKGNFTFPLTSIHGQSLPDGNYRIEINIVNSVTVDDVKLELSQTEKNRITLISDIQFGENKIILRAKVSGKSALNISALNSGIQIENMIINKN